MFLERLSLEQIELAYSGAVEEDLEYGAFSKRFALAVGRVAGHSAQASGGAFNMLMRQYLKVDMSTSRAGVIKTTNFPGVSHQIHGRNQSAVTVDSFLCTMYSICEDISTNRITPARFNLLLVAGNTILTPDEPPLQLPN